MNEQIYAEVQRHSQETRLAIGEVKQAFIEGKYDVVSERLRAYRGRMAGRLAALKGQLGEELREGGSESPDHD